MPGQKPREIAARLLSERHKGEFVEVLLERALERFELSPEDRRFLQELVYGAVRWELTLDWLIEQRSGGKPQKLLVQNLLRLALYQIFWLDRIPSYAAVNETVEICKRANLLPQARFINAVLRGYGRETDQVRARLAELRQRDLALGYSHPEWLCHRWEQRFGREQTVRLLEWNNSPPPTYARLNTLRASSAELTQAWAQEGVQFEPAEFPWTPPSLVFKITRHPPLNALPSLQNGFFYIQDPSTLLAPGLLAVKPGEHILDLCAAPGGKTTYLAQKIANAGEVVAEDLEPKRLKLVAANAERLGASSILIGPPRGEEKFDRILVDAPCSNTGVMRRRIELRWRTKPEEIRRLAQVQLQLLRQAASRLRPGGTLVYSTCSLEPEENSAVVREFLAQSPPFRLDQEREINPMTDRTDGAYCARLTSVAR